MKLLQQSGRSSLSRRFDEVEGKTAIPRNRGVVVTLLLRQGKKRISKVWQPMLNLENPSSRIPSTVTRDSCLRGNAANQRKLAAWRRRKREKGRNEGRWKRRRETRRCHDRDESPVHAVDRVALCALHFSSLSSTTVPLSLLFPLYRSLPLPLVLAFLPAAHEAPFTRYLDLSRLSWSNCHRVRDKRDHPFLWS